MKDDTSCRWSILVANYLASFTFGLTLQSLPPVLPILIQDLDLTHAEAGLTMSLFALPMILLSIPAGMVADRYGPRAVGLAAFVVVILGNLLVALSPSFPLLLAGRALAGIGAFTLVLISPQFVSQCFLGKELGLATGVWNTAFPLGTVISLATMGSIGQGLGWRTPIFITAGAAAACMTVFWLMTGCVASCGQRPKAVGSILSQLPRAGAPIWFVGLAWLFFNASNLSFLAFGPDYFESTGRAVAESGIMSSMVVWGTFFVSPLTGVLLDRGLRQEVVIGIGSLGLALAIMAIPLSPPLAVPALLLAAAANGVIVVAIFALPPHLLQPGLLGLGYGVLATCRNVGITLGPAVVGLTVDVASGYTASFWAMGTMALLVSVSILPLFASRRAALWARAATPRDS